MCLSYFTPFLGIITREKCLSLGWPLTFWYDPFCNHYQKSVFSPQFIRIVSKKSEDGCFLVGLSPLLQCVQAPQDFYLLFTFCYSNRMCTKKEA